MRIGKKGFSLVEVVVSLAIMTIVGGAVGAFLIAGNNSYLRGNKELTLQEEAQLAANQMIDLIIDVERDIEFTPDQTGTAVKTDGTAATDASGNTIADAKVSELLLVNNENTYMIRWQGSASVDYESANQVYLYEVKNNLDAEGNFESMGDIDAAEPALMAEHVSAFSVDTSQLADKRKVKLQMNFVYQDRSYDVDETIKLRNDLMAENSDFSWITALTIKPTHADVELGAVQKFEYSLSGDKEAVSQGVEWKVTKADGTACKSTIKEDGTLVVKGDEELGENVLLVTCTSVADPSKVATATVSVIERVVLKIDPTSVSVEQGSNFTFHSDLDTSSEEVKNGGVEWKVDKTDGSALNGTWINSSTGELHVGDNETPGTAVLTVTCTVSKRRTVKAQALVTVLEKSNIIDKYDCTLVRRDLYLYDLPNGNGRKGYKALIECLPSWADYNAGYPKIEWSVPSDYNHTYKITGLTDSDGRQFQAELECGENQDTTVEVWADVQLAANVRVKLSITIIIPPLNTLEDAEAPYITAEMDTTDNQYNRYGHDGFVLKRNGKIKCSIKQYDGAVFWYFLLMPCLLEESHLFQQ